MKLPKQFKRANVIPEQVERLRTKRDGLQTQLRDVEAKIADLEVEWADIQKEITNVLFGRSSLQEPQVGEPAPKKLKKKRKKGRRLVRVTKSSKVQGTRDEIRIAAKKRDEKLIAVLKKSKSPMTIHDLYAEVHNGNIDQIRTSIKRMRKLVNCKGTGRSARYTLKGRK